ncbi:hypothetical protein B591_27588 [Streptomyces sp. GBA 94-10 4N24]|nr:hypothetical protein B591_27588 [Streptomyces sp. GBA 94-10 4N24]UZN62525.1 hypothetical protein B591N_27588 [Streptomyces sp. GBA 94-10 4N24]
MGIVFRDRDVRDLRERLAYRGGSEGVTPSQSPDGACLLVSLRWLLVLCRGYGALLQALLVGGSYSPGNGVRCGRADARREQCSRDQFGSALELG